MRWRCQNQHLMSNYDAPKGQTWVCGACGKQNRNRTRVGDESCFLNAVLVIETSIVLGATGLVMKADAASLKEDC